MPELIQISKEQLLAALAAWERESRDGNWQPADPALSPEQVADTSVDYLWDKLKTH